MAFVNEQISEMDQKRINYRALKDPQTGTGIADLPRWTLDRENDVFLLGLGGGMSREDYHVPFYFLFSWKGVWMRVDAYRREVLSDGNRILIWEILKIYLPDTLLASHEHVAKLLTEALDAHGSNSYDTSRAMFKEVQVDFAQLQVAKFDLTNVMIGGNEK